MAYYSLYKIIKDIIKTLFGNKFFKKFLIFMGFFTIFFILGEKGVFATSYTLNTGETIEVDETNVDVLSGVSIIVLQYTYNGSIKYETYYTTYDNTLYNIGCSLYSNEFELVGLKNSDDNEYYPAQSFYYKSFSTSNSVPRFYYYS